MNIAPHAVERTVIILRFACGLECEFGKYVVVGFGTHYLPDVSCLVDGEHCTLRLDKLGFGNDGVSAHVFEYEDVALGYWLFKLWIHHVLFEAGEAHNVELGVACLLFSAGENVYGQFFHCTYFAEVVVVSVHVGYVSASYFFYAEDLTGEADVSCYERCAGLGEERRGLCFVGVALCKRFDGNFGIVLISGHVIASELLFEELRHIGKHTAPEADVLRRFFEECVGHLYHYAGTLSPCLNASVTAYVAVESYGREVWGGVDDAEGGVDVLGSGGMPKRLMKSPPRSILMRIPQVYFL